MSCSTRSLTSSSQRPSFWRPMYAWLLALLACLGLTGCPSTGQNVKPRPENRRPRPVTKRRRPARLPMRIKVLSYNGYVARYTIENRSRSFPTDRMTIYAFGTRCENGTGRWRRVMIDRRPLRPGYVRRRALRLPQRCRRINLRVFGYSYNERAMEIFELNTAPKFLDVL